MADRAAIVTGASSGIGLAIAHTLGELGYALTVAARRPEKLEAAAQELRDAGHEVISVAGPLTEEQTVIDVVKAHRDAYGRCDVLVNNAGVGLGAAVGEIQTKRLDMQLDLNVRAIVLFYREAIDMLEAAGAEHRQAHVFNTASVAGKSGQAWLSVYSATKFAVVGYTQAMNKELSPKGIKNVALCPAFVDTPMTDFAKAGGVSADDMITTADIATVVRAILSLSPACLVPEVVFERPGDDLL